MEGRLTSAPGTFPGWKQIHFHYFSDEELQQLRAQWKDVSVRAERPGLADVQHGIIPKLPLSFTSRKKMVVAVYDSDHQPVLGAARIRGPVERSDAVVDETTLREAKHDGRAAYYLGINAGHYGHFLLETLSRAWAWREHGQGRTAIVTTGPVRPFARAMCKLIPGLAKNLEILGTSTRFEHVIVPSPAFVIEREAHIEFKALCERMASRAIPFREPMTEQPLYLSRAGLSADANRCLVGELRLERFLESEGFRVVRPETLSIEEQIALVNRHKWIVSPMGSACHTRLFSCRPTTLLMLTRKLNANFVLCDLLSAGDAHYANVFSLPDLGTVVGAGPVMLEEERLLTLLRKFGLIRSTATFDSPPPDLKEYREKWIEFVKTRPARNRGGKLQQIMNGFERSSED